MDLRVKAWQLPPRLITGAYFLNSGLARDRTGPDLAQLRPEPAAGPYSAQRRGRAGPAPGRRVVAAPVSDHRALVVEFDIAAS